MGCDDMIDGLMAQSSIRTLTFEWNTHQYSASMACVPTACLAPIELQMFKSLLHRDELAGLGEGAAFSRQHDYVMGRVAAKMALMAGSGAADEVFSGEWTALRILPGVFGQPVLCVDGDAGQSGVSISHHEGLAVGLAFDRRHPMALDAELVVANQEEAFAQMVDSEERLGMRKSLPHLKEVERLALIWTCKEALGKAMGCGLTVPPDFLAVQGNSHDISFELFRAGGRGVRGMYRHCPQFAWHAWRLPHSWLTIAAPAQSRLVGVSSDRRHCMQQSARTTAGAGAIDSSGTPAAFDGHVH